MGHLAVAHSSIHSLGFSSTPRKASRMTTCGLLVAQLKKLKKLQHKTSSFLSSLLRLNSNWTGDDLRDEQLSALSRLEPFSFTQLFSSLLLDAAYEMMILINWPLFRVCLANLEAHSSTLSLFQWPVSVSGD